MQDAHEAENKMHTGLASVQRRGQATRQSLDDTSQSSLVSHSFHGTDTAICICRAQQEAAEKKKTDLASALQQRKASKQAGLQAEPPAGTPNTAALRIRLPDGSTAQRRFLADQPLQVIELLRTGSVLALCTVLKMHALSLQTNCFA